MKKEELSLKDIQKVSLKILIDIHDFCVSQGITYSLMYGTLLGAVRHKGFIPWDDDIDIMMPRKDYTRFCHTFKAPGRGLTWEEDPDCLINFCKVYDLSETTSHQIPPFQNGHNGGVHVDVFPVDDVSDSFDLFKEAYQAIYPKWRQQIRFRNAKNSVHDILKIFPPKDILILFAIKFFGHADKQIRQINQSIRDIIAQGSAQESHHFTDWGAPDVGLRNYHEKNLFDTVVDLPFEGHSFKALAGYDAYLTNVYGDYMTPPPPEKRHPLHSRCKYYWKHS